MEQKVLFVSREVVARLGQVYAVERVREMKREIKRLASSKPDQKDAASFRTLVLAPASLSSFFHAFFLLLLLNLGPLVKALAAKDPIVDLYWDRSTPKMVLV